MSKEVMREVLHSMQNFQKLYGNSFFTDEIKQVKKLLATCQRCGEVNPAEIHTCTPVEPVSDAYKLEVVAWTYPEYLDKDGYGYSFSVFESPSGTTDMVPLYIKKQIDD